MNQNANVFIMIGCIALSCGQYIFTEKLKEEITEKAKLREEMKKASLFAADIFDVLTASISFYLTNIEDYIGELSTSDNPFNFDKNKIEDPIIHKIKRAIDFLYQKETLDVFYSKPEFLPNAGKVSQNITSQVERFLAKFDTYINKLNVVSKRKNYEKRLSMKDFATTAQTIRVMKGVIDNLYVWLQSKFRNDDVQLIDDLTESIAVQNQTLSTLKTNLYNIYKVKQEADNKITILRDITWSILGYPLFLRRLRSQPQDDLLVGIPLFFEKETLDEKVRRAIEAFVPAV